ncbi:hypothetical protein SAMN05519103_08042 [Rhizobiales bacterium GAS113]|jgi:hypothetical protein|nr:hypothetical protein SAMN05519103_08042 [Rhizobiales bacterium GAS113]
MRRSMFTARFRLAACALLLALAGCNQTAQAPQPQAAAATPAGYATERYTPAGFALPNGSGCQGDVSRFRAVMSNDYQTGNVNLSVYKQIGAEIDQADHVCASGNSAQASAMIHATKSKFGYP